MPAELVAELESRAPRSGANVGVWPGMTVYRFIEPTEPRWEEIHGLSLGIVARGRKAVTDEGRRYVYDESSYLVISSHLRFQSEVLTASPIDPCLCLVLHIDPALVRRVSVEMLEGRGSPLQRPAPAERYDRRVLVSPLDDELTGAVVRFLRALSTGPDRRVLAPLYLQEVVYRVLQRDQFGRLLQVAGEQTAGNQVAAALTYINEHLADPLTVSALAERVNLSTSAFTRAFREITGRSPYQFVKESRLNRARDLLLEDRRSVAELADAVGYTSTSHFIKEFRGRFGTTPRDYADTHALRRALWPVRSDAG